MLLQLQLSRVDWLVRGSSLVLFTLLRGLLSPAKQKAHHTPHHRRLCRLLGGWGGGLAWCVQCSASYRADGRAAVSTSDRLASYSTQNENTKNLECSEGVLCSDAIRMANATRHSPQNIEYSQLSLSWKRFHLCVWPVPRHSYEISFHKLLAGE